MSADAGGEGGQLRVFLADDHAIVRSGIRGYLELTGDLTLAGEAGSGQETLDRLAALEPAGMLPDVVLMDLVMPGMDGIEATRQIKTRWPDVEVVAVTSFADQAKVIAALQAGAAGYVLKDADVTGSRPRSAPPQPGNATSTRPSLGCSPTRCAAPGQPPALSRRGNARSWPRSPLG